MRHPRKTRAELCRCGSLSACFLNSSSLPLHGKRLTDHLFIQSSPAPSASELLPPPSPQETGRPPQSSFTLDSCEQALQRLINGDLPQDERATVIESIYSSQEATNIIGRLREKDAQTFIDIVHEVRYHSSISSGVGRMTLFLTLLCYIRRRWGPSTLHRKSGGGT